MGTVQKWLVMMAGLGALVIVVANPNGVFSAAKAVTQVVGGTESTIITARATQTGG
jgi:hypothetical protein